MNWKKLAVCVIGSELIGASGSLFTMPAIPTWYATLNKPVLTPPNWIFAPVWTILFALIGLALYLVLESKASTKDHSKAKVIFGIQFVFNLLWSYLFFGLQNPLWAFGCIIFLWISIAAMTRCFCKINPLAGKILLPYLLWVSFAAYLNYSIILLNPT